MVCYDCSMISNFKIDKDLKHLELHYCGQLSDYELNKIIEFNKKLKSLIITGAFLIENINFAKTNKYEEVNVSNCARLGDFLFKINKLKN